MQAESRPPSKWGGRLASEGCKEQVKETQTCDCPRNFHNNWVAANYWNERLFPTTSYLHTDALHVVRVCLLWRAILRTAPDRNRPHAQFSAVGRDSKAQTIMRRLEMRLWCSCVARFQFSPSADWHDLRSWLGEDEASEPKIALLEEAEWQRLALLCWYAALENLHRCLNNSPPSAF